MDGGWHVQVGRKRAQRWPRRRRRRPCQLWQGLERRRRREQRSEAEERSRHWIGTFRDTGAMHAVQRAARLRRGVRHRPSRGGNCIKRGPLRTTYPRSARAILPSPSDVRTHSAIPKEKKSSSPWTHAAHNKRQKSRETKHAHHIRPQTPPPRDQRILSGSRVLSTHALLTRPSPPPPPPPQAAHLRGRHSICGLAARA